MTFDEWFDTNGYGEEHRAMFRTVWDAAQDNMPGEEASIYLTPEERAVKQAQLNASYSNLLHNAVTKLREW